MRTTWDLSTFVAVRLTRALGDEQRAEKDFRAAIQVFESRRTLVADEENRISYFDQAQLGFREMVRLQAVQRRRADLAMDFVERARARSLLDSLAADPIGQGERGSGHLVGGPLKTAEIVRILPPGVALIEYFLLEDRLLAWLIRADGIRMSERPLDRRWLEARVYSLRAAIELGSAANNEYKGAEELYEILVGDFLPDLPPEESVVFVPDGVLHLVPFSALRNPGTGHLLVEDREVTVAASATAYALAVSSRRERLARAPRSLLAVGNPAISRDEFLDLPDLKGAEDEASRLGALYPKSSVLTGAAATRSRIEEILPQAEVFQFSGHAMVNEEVPWHSRLLVTPMGSDSESGSLLLSDIARLPLAHLQVVILGACSTGTGRVWSNEGVVGLVRPFLAAGVPAVVASLWNVDDRTSAELIVALHERLLLGEAPTAALRAAQLQLLRSRNSELRAPASWAAFQVYGGPSQASSN